MKAALLNVWKENDIRLAGCPLILGLLFVIVASLLGVLQDNGSGAISRFLSAPR